MAVLVGCGASYLFFRLLLFFFFLEGSGLGKAVMAVLVGCARAVSRVGLELTTMQGTRFTCFTSTTVLALLEQKVESTLTQTTLQGNARGKAVYVACGFEELGIILNPLGCDVTAAFQGRYTDGSPERRCLPPLRVLLQQLQLQQ